MLFDRLSDQNEERNILTGNLDIVTKLVELEKSKASKEKIYIDA